MGQNRSSRHAVIFTNTVLLLLSTAALAGGSSIGILPDPTCVETVPIDHVCIEDPVFPPDCETQLGSIGGPPLPPTDEGYMGLMSPIVDPMLRLRTTDDRNGRLYALNPADNKVRVWTPDGFSLVKDIQACYRPSALAQSGDGGEIYVSCHASHSVGIIDTDSNRMVDVIQDRDNLGRPRLQEPMGMAVVGNLLYVASSQSHEVAVVDLTTRRVLRYIGIPGQDPRTLTLAGDGVWLIVANFLAGNRTEPERPDLANANLPQECQDLLQDPTALAVFEETSPQFMDTSHPDYPMIAECYLHEHISGGTQLVTKNPDRPDHDLVVVRLTDEQVVFTTDLFATDIGTLNYDVQFDPFSSQVYLATVHARNDLNANFGRRPLINRLVVMGFDMASGALSLNAVTGIKDLDAPFLDQCDEGAALAATPYALDVDETRVAIAATGSDRLVLTDKSGNITSTIPVGFGPKGVLLGPANQAWVYNSTGLSVSQVDLVSQLGTEASIGDNQIPQLVRIGARLFNSAEFAKNDTFSCASCHPDGHLDGLVWRLNDTDRLRATMTLQEIRETAAYHWDGSKCNQVKILQDGITNLFGGSEPTDCEMKTMIDFMDHLIRPHSPYRPVDDSMTADSSLGSAIFHRATFKDRDDDVQNCSDRLQDMTVEDKYLEEIGDPNNPFFAFGGGGGPIRNTTDSESCSVSSCHVAPHTESDGLNQMGQLRDGFQAVSTLASWDRNVTMHDGRMARAKYIEALDTNRAFHGATIVNPGDNFSGVVATHGFNSAFFRHPEYNFDNDPTTHGFPLSDDLTEFIKQEEELHSGALGLTAVITRAGTAVDAGLLGVLESAADQGKITLLGVGTIAGVPTTLTWQPGSATYRTHDGQSLTRAQLQQAMDHGDSMVLYGGLLPNQGSAPNPKLKGVLRDTSPYLCREGYAEYQGAVLVGETDVPLTLQGIEVVAGSKVLIDGQVAGAPLNGAGPDFSWKLAEAPSEPTVLNIQILGPTGMLSNSLPLPVVPAVVPATEPLIGQVLKGTGSPSFALVWDNQFGLTGPGTRYDVYRGSLSDLPGTGFGAGLCLTDPPTAIFAIADDDQPNPGEGFYYVVRAQNQVNQSTWGTAQRDVEINGAANSCAAMFP